MEEVRASEVRREVRVGVWRRGSRLVNSEERRVSDGEEVASLSFVVCW